MDEYENKVSYENLDNKYLENMCLKRTSNNVLINTVTTNKGEEENNFDLANEKGIYHNFTEFYSNKEYRDRKIETGMKNMENQREVND